MLEQIDWESVRADAFTVIRMWFSVETLVKLAREGNHTPVSGDELSMVMRRKS